MPGHHNNESCGCGYCRIQRMHENRHEGMKIKNSKKYAIIFCLGAVAFGGMVLLLKKIFPRRRMGLAEKTGQNIDSSIKNAMEYLENATKTLHDAADAGAVKSFGKSIDEALAEAVASIQKVKLAVKGAAVK